MLLNQLQYKYLQPHEVIKRRIKDFVWANDLEDVTQHYGYIVEQLGFGGVSVSDISRALGVTIHAVHKIFYNYKLHSVKQNFALNLRYRYFNSTETYLLIRKMLAKIGIDPNELDKSDRRRTSVRLIQLAIWICRELYISLDEVAEACGLDKSTVGTYARRITDTLYGDVDTDNIVDTINSMTDAISDYDCVEIRND